MMNPQGMSFIKLLLISAVALTMGLGCEKKVEEETDEESTTPAVKINDGSPGGYYTSCVQTPGVGIGGIQYYTKSLYLMNAGGTENAYTVTKYFTSDAACNTNVFAIVQGGAFSVGTAIPGLTNGYAIAFQAASLQLILFTNAASTNMQAGCPSWYPLDQGSGVYTVSGSPAACSYMNMISSGTLYNSIVIDGSSTLTLGIPDGDNPGVTNSSNLSLTQAISITK
ncbi:hypothetical protein [Bdellovibrio sp. HCB337]|uniref:hypothetical protein n=1 Tax=Bdellovibrio sp. HCB337 TaxID=3394358 RepID=UPI0039A7540A